MSKPELAAFDEWMNGDWSAVRVAELKPGMKMRDEAGGCAAITGVYPSANDCMFVQSSGGIGVHIPKMKLALVKP